MSDMEKALRAKAEDYACRVYQEERSPRHRGHGRPGSAYALAMAYAYIDAADMIKASQKGGGQ